MVKMKTSSASYICLLFCALIVSTLVSIAGTTSTTTSVTGMPVFQSSETDKFEDWDKNHISSSTTVENEKYGSMTTLSVTGLNDLQYNVTDDVIDSSTIPENEYHRSDKEYSSTKPMTTININQSFEEPPNRTDPLITTTIANDSTTTPSTPSGMDLNDTTVADDVGGVRTTENVIGNSPKPSNKEYSSTEPIPISTNAQTTFEKPSTRPTKRIKSTNKNCRHKKHEEYTTTTKILGPSNSTNFNQWEQQRHMMETTTSNFNERLEKSKKWELQQKVLEMESNRFNTILDLFNSRK